MQNLSPHAEICEQRAIGLWRLATQRVPITILPVASALLRIEPADFYRQLALTLRVGEELPLEDVVAHLESIGYERREPVEMVGEYSVRGGILDVFSPEAPKPVRIDLFGDQVESIRRFDVESQRSVLKVEDCTLLPLDRISEVARRCWANWASCMREAGVPGRDLPPPGEPFPGWELLAPMAPAAQRLGLLAAGPRRSCSGTSRSRCRRPPSASGSAWSRSSAPPAYDPDRIFFRWEELERQAAAAPQVAFQQLEIGWSPTAPRPASTSPRARP